MRKFLYPVFLKAAIGFLLLLNSFKCYSQSDSLVFYPVTNPTLQQYIIGRIVAAKDNKLWLGTEKGLISYDGNDVHLYSHTDNDSTSFSGSGVSNLFMDNKGNLFCVQGSEKQEVNGQIDYFNTTTGKVQRLKIKIQREDSSAYDMEMPIWFVCRANDNTILAARYGMGFIQYNLFTKKAKSYSLLSARNPKHNFVYVIRQDIKDNNLFWLATDDGIYSFNIQSNKLERKFICDNKKDSTDFDVDIRDLKVKSNDTIWFTNHIRGVGYYNMKTGHYTIFPHVRKNGKKEEKLFTWDFQYTNNNQYLVMMAGRPPCKFNTITHEYIFNSKMLDGLPEVYNTHVLIDSLENIWMVAYYKLCIAKQMENKFTSVSIHDSYYEDQYSNIFKTVVWDETRNVYYVAFDRSDGIFVFNKDMQLLKSIPGPQHDNPAWGLVEPLVFDIGLDKNKQLWMCGDVISMYDSLRQKMVPADDMYAKLKPLHQPFRNLVFRGSYLYALPVTASSRYLSSSRYLYKIDVDKFTCDSVLLSEIPVAEPLELDNRGENAYFSNKKAVFQYNLLTGKTRKIIELDSSKFHWYNVDDDDNLWVSSLTQTWIIEPFNLSLLKIIEREKNTAFQAYNVKGKGVMCFVNSTSYELYDYKNWNRYQLTIDDGLTTYLNSGTAVANNLLFVGGMNYMQYIPLSSVIKTSKERKCYLSDIQVFNKSLPTDTLPEYLHSLKLPHNKNHISFTFSCVEFGEPEKMEYRYKLDGEDNDWIYVGYLNRTVSYTNLSPGSYTFHASVKNDDGNWSNNNVNMEIIIIPAWWQTSSFKIACIVAACVLAFVLIRWRIKTVRTHEREKARIEKEILELEAKALRAQMNPHFIFNCMNSIKSLIQQHEEEKAVTYLTTFSKLIRTLFNSADKKEISLYDEIETCKLYLQLEAMRFNNKLSYSVNIDENIDLKSIYVPALIIQPFIENSIWHGIVPRETGGTVLLNVMKANGTVKIVVDDNGIGRESSQQNKSLSGLAHQSKGVSLTQSRLELDNLLKQRKAKLEIFDKKDENEMATGTAAIITLSEES